MKSFFFRYVCSSLIIKILIFKFHRFIPRRIDLDCDYALDTIVSQNLQISSHSISSNDGQTISVEQQQQLIHQQRRMQKRSNQPTQSRSSRKTLELLEHFMPQNRRIYNFGVKTLKPRPIGTFLLLHIYTIIVNFIKFKIQVILLDELKH